MKVCMPKVGDRFFAKSISSVKTNNDHIKTIEVVYVGRKYFVCVNIEHLQIHTQNKHLRTEYYIDRGRYVEKSEYSQEYDLYHTMQDIEDEKESINIHNELKSYFDKRKPTLSISKLRSIRDIINS